MQKEFRLIFIPDSLEHCVYEDTNIIPSNRVVKKVKSNDTYLNKRDMYEELVEYNKTKVISERLAKMFQTLARKFSTHSWFFRYTYREDMIADAVSKMVEKVSNFDLNHPSADPFAYFTRIAYCQFRQMIKKENRQTQTREEYRAEVWAEQCITEDMLEEPKEIDLNSHMM
jgi:chromatin segregation and condensation protein Rec8/ScpA/Scc1 (kleisin family)